MTIEDIKEIIKKDESRTLEVKETTGELVKAMCSACAFLNSDGGWLLFGISPKMKITGQQVTDNTKIEIANHLRKIEPSINVVVNYVELFEKPNNFVIAIYFDPTNFTNAPYTYDGRAYYKLESTTSIMSRQMYEDRLKVSNPERFSWERNPNQDLNINDLDENLILLTLQDGVNNRRIHASALTHTNIKDILSGLGLINREGILLNAANVLFGKNPTKYHMQCGIRLARFEGNDKMEFRDQTVIEGNLFEQYDETIDFCRKHLFLSGRMNEKTRIDTLTVPFEVIKESVMNMLCHRSWDADNMTPSLAIYDDRIELQNPGTFPSGYTWEDFTNFFNSIPHNPLIASVFYRRGLMERWGRGIGLIMKKCTKAGLPTPKFTIDYSTVTLTIKFRQSLALNDGLNGGLNGGLNDGLNGGLNLNERELQIIELLRNKPNSTINEIAASAGCSKRTIERSVAELKSKGIIDKEGSKKNGVWRVNNNI